MADPADNDSVGWVIRAPSMWNWFWKTFRFPVIAIRGRDIYKVLLLGEGVEIEGYGEQPIGGFYTHRYVAAENVIEAHNRAKREVLLDWERGGWAKHTKGTLRIEVDEIEPIDDRFLSRRGYGFCFFPKSEIE